MNTPLRFNAAPGNNYWPFYFLLIALFLVISSVSKGQTYPAGFSQVQVANGIDDPTALAFAPASDGRIFVTEQGGKLRVIKNGALLSTAAVSLTVNSDGERGLIGIALDPDFTTNNYVYLYYTLTSPLRNRISRFTLSGDVVISGSEQIVLELDALSSATNHNGGAMEFGPDGMLYVGVGDNATGANAQDLDTYHGKMLRINANGSVPSGNPFTTGSGQRQRVWAYGLRNPYTFEFQPGTGKLYVNDVGQGSWEEVNNATTGGLNFGWPSAEGTSSNPSYTNPVYSYGHGSGDGLGCAITGGTFFNPASTEYPSQYSGKYFFMEYCEKWINYIDPTATNPTRSAFATGLSGSPLALKTGPDGNLYYLSRSNEALYRISYGTTSATALPRVSEVASIYPLPATDVVNVILNQPLADDYTLSITDYVGNKMTVPYNRNKALLEFDVALLPAGIYALKIEYSGTSIVQEIVVIR